ncbi:MAG: OpgC domain-containing protein, partial [Opitutaceae bacterium]
MAVPSAKPPRDLRFDSLRGLMLIMMTVNHLPSGLRFLTDKPCGIFSAAEGFVFLSGIMAGWVYTRRRHREGSAGLWKATRGRANMIYRWHMGSFLGALVAVRVTDVLFGFCSQNSPLLFYQHPFLAIALGSVLLYQPGMLDILPLYCAVVVALPWVLDQLETGHRKRILTLSGAIWALVQFAPPVDGGRFYPFVVGSFNVLAWQFIFFLGAVVGHAKADPDRDILPFRPLGLLAAAAV